MTIRQKNRLLYCRALIRGSGNFDRFDISDPLLKKEAETPILPITEFNSAQKLQVLLTRIEKPPAHR